MEILQLRTLCGTICFMLMMLVQLAMASGPTHPTGGSPGPALNLPFRAHELTLDGNAEDWVNGSTFAFAEDTGEVRARNVVTGKLAWDSEALWVYAEVQDAELIMPPFGVNESALRPERFHLFDVLQIYLDPNADSSTQMNLDDVNILLLPNGQAACLRGDTLLAELFAAKVPQRAGAPLALQYQAKLNTSGWQFELRIPFQALGQSVAPKTMRMDITMQDWRIDSSRLPAGSQPNAAQLLSVSWTNLRDFGYPYNWRLLQLQGQAPWQERLVQRLGAFGLGLLLVLLSALLSSLLLLLLARRYAKRQRELQALIADLEHQLASSHVVSSVTNLTTDIPTVEGNESIGANNAGQDNAPREASPRSEIDLPDSSDPRDLAFANRIVQAVLAQPTADHSVEALAQRFHLSVRTLQRRVKSGTGATPNELVLATRLKQARAMVQSGQYRISEVALQVGINDLAYFSRCYKRAFGVAPSMDA